MTAAFPGPVIRIQGWMPKGLFLKTQDDGESLVRNLSRLLGVRRLSMGTNRLRRICSHIISKGSLRVLVALYAFAEPSLALEKLVFEIPRSESTSFELVDVRDVAERLNRQPSNIQLTLGDEEFDPSPVRILGSLLQLKLGDQLSGKSLTLTKFDVSVFSQRKWARGDQNPMFGVLIPALVDIFGARTNVVCRVWVVVDGKEHEGLSFIDDIGSNKEEALHKVVVDSIEALAKSIGTSVAPPSSLTPERTR